MSKTYIKFLEPYEKELSKKIKKKGLTITVSGKSGSGKSLGAESIAKALKLKYVSIGEILRKIAKEKGMSLVKMSQIRKPEIDHEMDKQSLKLAMEGNVVLDGRLTGWVAGDWADVKIYYVCSLETKAKRVARRDKISAEEAKKRIVKRDEEDHKKYRQLYGINSYDESIYNVIINNEKLTKEEAKVIPVKLVKEFLEKKRHSS
ncbi:MAG: cytidylate kinase family protein [Candidatus Aenigmarchaeota archaeon]|nr:cytidylate kinase family protein [Candidatus Aenigmarchaeota archaeon]